MKQFYWDAYWIVRKGAPSWTFVMHDSFRGYPAAWWDFMKGCPKKAMDSHIYQAWNRPSLIQTYYNNACNFRGGVRVMEDLVDMPMIVGEWSLATDNCAMWLNGFNDNLPGYPKVVCQMMPCAAPYMGEQQPGAPPSKGMPLQGPYGTGVSGPQFGDCPVGVEWGSKEDEYMTTLTMKQIASFNAGHGWFFWNFRTEIEPRWSFNTAWYTGWFPRNISDFRDKDVMSACPEHPDSIAAGAAAVAASPQAQQQQQQLTALASLPQQAASVPPSTGQQLTSPWPLLIIGSVTIAAALVVGYRLSALLHQAALSPDGPTRGATLRARLLTIVRDQESADQQAGESSYSMYQPIGKPA